MSGRGLRHYRILGVDMVDQTMAEAVADVAALAAGSGPRSLFFANAHTLNNVAADPSYRAVLNRATRVFGDGTGVRWAARLQGVRLQANLNGTDLVPELFRNVDGLRCFILGSAPDRVDAILAGARARFPKVEFVGAHHGYLDEETSLPVIDAVNASRANVVLVGMGNPLQERWIDRYGAAMPQALCIAVGGLLEYWGGGLERAPAAMRRLGIEWVHLMLAQPRKVPRYLLGNPVYLARVLAARRADMRPPAARERDG